jgi:hypothetical protein
MVLTPVLVLALAASVWVTVKTADHIGQGYDSSSYLGTAAEIRAGHGPTVPFTDVWDQYPPRAAVAFAGHVPSTHFPPGYASVVAAISGVTGGISSAARAMSVLMIFINLMLVGLLTARLTSYRNAVVPALAAGLLVLVPDTAPTGFLGPQLGWLSLHLGAYSEPLFMALTTGALLATGTALGERALTATRARRALGLAVVLAAGALLTRYAGVAVVVTVAAAVAVLGRFERVRTRLAVAAGIAAVAAVPTLIFVAWGAWRGSGNARPLSYHPAPRNGDLVRTLGQYFLPFGWPTWTLVLLLVALTVGIVLVALPGSRAGGAVWKTDDRARVLARVVAAFVVIYIATVVLSRTFLDISTPLDARLLSPVRGVAYALVLAVAYRLLADRVRVVGSVAVLTVLCLALVVTNWHDERATLDYGTGPAVVLSPTDLALRSLPKNTLIASNLAQAVSSRTNRNALNLPERKVYVTGKPNRAFEDELAQWAAILRSRPSYVFLIFPNIPAATQFGDLAKLVPLKLVSHTGIEYLYQVVRPSA